MHCAGLTSRRDDRFGVTSVPRVDVELNPPLSSSTLCADVTLLVC